jgi:transposase
MSKGKRNLKAERLKENDSLNLHPERVRAEQFQRSTFFDPLDLVQVKYEMLREVSREGASKVQAAASYGMSRHAFYQALNAFTRGGIAALLPGQRGPKGAHKLTDEVMSFVEQRRAADHGLHARALALALHEELHVDVHPRSIERALARKKKR